MRRYLLDTAPLAAYLLGRSAATNLISPWVQQREVATSILAYGEVIEYLRSMPNYLRLRGQLRFILRAVTPAGPTYPIMERYSELRRMMRPPHGNGLIGDIDTVIAATALEWGLTLVTSDRDFQRIPGLSVLLASLKS